ncbi:hypothetical protein QCA50_000544 [Cerrena zonata]|uniref:Membrane insertase YidC/Oxa/ALB C-terminal domain-containing protein n=1 Tax=Cerrena zonata TaxID=2478898 RepID=A0AAW0GZV2_9APHY
MLASTSTRLLCRRFVPHQHQPRRNEVLRQLNHRTFVSSTLQTLGDGFLDLAVAIPYPQSLPPYSGTIILVTVVSRLFITVPFSIWAKRRQWKAEDVVVPELKQERPQLYKKVLADMHKDKFRGNEDEARMEFEKRMRPTLKAKQRELFAKHGCSPTATMLIPMASQLPLFVGTSMLFSRLSQHPTVFDSESFLTLTSLSHSDPTLTLPIVLGLITLANVESSRWFMSADALERERKVSQWTAEKRAKGHTVLQPKKIIQSSMRLFSIGRILIAAMVPGSVQLYWVTSATFGLLQTWVLDYWDSRRPRVVTTEADQKPESSKSSPASPSPRSPKKQGK